MWRRDRRGVGVGAEDRRRPWRRARWLAGEGLPPMSCARYVSSLHPSRHADVREDVDVGLQGLARDDRRDARVRTPSGSDDLRLHPRVTDQHRVEANRHRGRPPSEGGARRVDAQQVGGEAESRRAALSISPPLKIVLSLFSPRRASGHRSPCPRGRPASTRQTKLHPRHRDMGMGAGGATATPRRGQPVPLQGHGLTGRERPPPARSAVRSGRGRPERPRASMIASRS